MRMILLFLAGVAGVVGGIAINNLTVAAISGGVGALALLVRRVSRRSGTYCPTSGTSSCPANGSRFCTGC